MTQRKWPTSGATRVRFRESAGAGPAFATDVRVSGVPVGSIGQVGYFLRPVSNPGRPCSKPCSTLTTFLFSSTFTVASPERQINPVSRSPFFSDSTGFVPSKNDTAIGQMLHGIVVRIDRDAAACVGVGAAEN